MASSRCLMAKSTALAWVRSRQLLYSSRGRQEAGDTPGSARPNNTSLKFLNSDREHTWQAML